MVDILSLYLSWCRLERHEGQRRRQTEFQNYRQTHMSQNCLKRVYIWSIQVQDLFLEIANKCLHSFTIKVNQNQPLLTSYIFSYFRKSTFQITNSHSKINEIFFKVKHFSGLHRSRYNIIFHFAGKQKKICNLMKIDDVQYIEFLFSSSSFRILWFFWENFLFIHIFFDNIDGIMIKYDLIMYDINKFSTIYFLQYSLLQTVVEACQKKRHCKFLASPRTFGGDPCPGLRKFIEVAYKCRPCK